jgi:glutaredoxin-dependent peroxiredoxin
VLGLCVESDRAHTAFANHLNLPFPLLSDFNRQVVQQFGIAYTPEQPFSGFWGMGKRSVFLVDQHGIIRYSWVTDDPLVAPDVNAVLDALAQARALNS